MKKLGQSLLVYVIGSLLVEGIVLVVNNLMEGKDILGHEPDPKKTRVDTNGKVHLGTDDYLVV